MNNPENIATHPISYDGKLGQQYKIFILNIFLGLITLGIYHYWGKTRQRRYTTASFSVFNDRFEYTGYGGELFWGFIKAIIIIGILSIPFFYALYEIHPITQKMEQFEKQQKEKEKAHATTSSAHHDNASEPPSAFEQLTDKEKKVYFKSMGIIGCYMIFYYGFLSFAAVYGSLRYRITHSRWRGIRGHMLGSSIVYGFVGFGHTILKILTLGFWIPFADAMTWKYKMNRIYFGDQQANFSPQYGKLFKSYILTLCVFLFIIVVMIILGNLYLHNGLEDEILFIAMCYIMGAIGLFLPRFWYRACLIRMKYNNLKFGNIGFICTISGWALFKQTIGNLLILVFTLTLGKPIVTQRRMKFFCKHVSITGDIEKTNILQAGGEKDKAGEGLSTLIDMNISLF